MLNFATYLPLLVALRMFEYAVSYKWKIISGTEGVENLAKKNLTAARVDGVRANGKLQELRDHIVANLYLRVRPNGSKSWVVRYTDPVTGAERKLYTIRDVATDGKSIDDARDAARRFLSDLLKTQKNPKTIKAEKKALLEKEKRQSVSIAELIPLYEPFLSHLKDPHSRLTDLKLVAKSNLGQKPIAKLTAKDIQIYVKEEQDAGRRNRTINKKITELYGMISALHRHQILTPNEVSLPPKPKKLPETDSQKNRRYFESGERAALVAKSKNLASKIPWLYPAVILSLNTGIRPNSLFHLTWGDIDWQAKTLRLDARYMKTKDEWILPFNTLAEEALKYLERQLTKNGTKPEPGEYILQNNGHEINEEDWRHAFDTLKLRCGIENATWYNMRHDFASQLVMQGVSLITVRDLMCHKNISTTQVYAHLAPDLKTAAVKLLERL